jgi:2-polyprenyl-3-methyl-5-hydroxy-6-metoxy-1,4-benzoquinol methylase
MENYDQTYKSTDDYFGDVSSLLAAHMGEIKPGGHVLDIGVGQGRNALALAAQGFRVTGIDTSAKAIEQCRAAASAQGLDIELHHVDVFDHQATGPYDAILCFGLMQILSRGDNASLIHRIYDWTHPSSALFLSAWHVDDPSYDRIRDSWEKSALHSFVSPDGEYRTYMARNSVRDLFRKWNVVHYNECLGELHRHGEGEEHQHGDIELVAVRRSVLS